jgi:23S rRNA (uracil1939-C5)-methyltransferase
MRQNHHSTESAASFEVEIEKLVYGGEGLGRHGGQVVFVPFTVPGDRVEVRPHERKKNFVRATVTKMLTPGAGRIDPPCPHFGRCGGCQWQHLEYPRQVEAKRRILEETFHHHFPETRQLSISMKACPDPYGYRSRARVQLRGTGDQAQVGFFRTRSHLVEDVQSCPLFCPPLLKALSFVRQSQGEGRLGPGEMELELACDEDGGWAVAIEDSPASEADETLRSVLRRRVGDFVYEAAASVFFQANEYMLSDLIAAALRPARGGNAALDLFAGVGFFSLPLASRYRSVVAVESDSTAHQLCLSNIALAGLLNVQAVRAEAAEWMHALGSVAAPAYDLVLLDPPRTGVSVEIMKRLAEWAPETIVYVSCDPKTLVRDLAALPGRDYRICCVEGLDMFPQTFHFETVTVLNRR